MRDVLRVWGLFLSLRPWSETSHAPDHQFVNFEPSDPSAAHRQPSDRNSADSQSADGECAQR